jgi:flagellin
MPRINHNISAMITSSSLADVDREMAKSLQKLSTGLRINSAADDAAGLSISNQLQTQVTGLAQGQRNAQDGSSLVTIADGALNEVQSILQRMRELSIQSANDTLTSVERGYTETEFDQLRSEIDRIVGATQFNSMNLLDGSAPWGSAAGGVIHVGPNNTANDVINITIAGVSTGALTITANGLDKNGVADHVFITDQVSATNAISSLDIALQSVNTLRSNLGAIANRLADAITNQENQQTNMAAAESTIRDVDFATETTEFTREQILSQSSTAMLAQANQLPQSVLTLLK